jgi:hypothetical protein
MSMIFLLKNHFCLRAKESFGIVHKFCIFDKFGMAHNINCAIPNDSLPDMKWHTNVINQRIIFQDMLGQIVQSHTYTKYWWETNPQETKSNCLVSRVFSLHHLSDHRLSRRAFPVTKKITKARLNLSM